MVRPKNIRKKLLVAGWVLIVLIWPSGSDHIDPKDLERDSKERQGLYRDSITEANFGLLGVDIFQTKNGEKNWKMHSRFAELHRKENYAFLKQVQTEFFSHRTGNVVYTESDYGRSLTDKDYVELEGNVLIRSQKGYEFTMNKLDYDGAEHEFRTNELVKMKGPVVAKPAMLLEGEGLVGSIDREHFILKKNVVSQKRIKKNQWMRISSKKGEFFTNENRAIFDGNVHSKLPDMVVEGNKMELKMDGEEESILVHGNVKMVQKTKVAYADSAVIVVGGSQVLLEGRASVNSKGNTIRGERITFYTDEDRIEVQEAEGKIKRETEKETD